jgi:O-antigen/teichoic acid export membrane protein
MTVIYHALSSDGLFGRLIRSVGWTAFGFGAAQAIRLISNLIFARLLFPEAFGLMALVSVFLVGLSMFSDVGLGSSIMQNKRGDDPDFLNTAWTIQVIRGFILWLGACALAWPAAHFYGEPQLALFLPVAGLSLLIAGFNPTQIETANRHLRLERVVMLDLSSQVIGAIAMVALALLTRSVWALVIGLVIGAAAKLVLAHVLLPQAGNRLSWEPQAARELIHFGKWLFLSTALAFLIAQGDKAILGKYLSLDMLGIYNIGYFLASSPLLLGGAIISRTLIPLYREKPPGASAENFRKIRFVRFGLTGGLLTLVLLMAFCGVWLVNILYDPRYSAAGAIIVMIACAQILQVIGLTYDQSALAAGDSRSFFFLFAARATVQIAFFVTGVEMGGLIGALAGQGLSMLIVHPLIILLARRHNAWDPLHDVLFALAGLSLGGIALWLNRDAIGALAGLGTM